MVRPPPPPPKKKWQQHNPLHTSILCPYRYMRISWLSVCSPQVFKATIRDDGASYSFTCFRCLLQVWQRTCAVYVQQPQHRFSSPFSTYVDWNISTHLISLWYFGTRVYTVSRVSTMLVRKSSLPSGNFSIFRKEPSIPAWTIVPPIKHTGINRPLKILV